MYVFTHYVLGGIILAQITPRLPFALDGYSFRWGNVLPDISVNLRDIPHYMEDSYQFVQTQLTLLGSIPISRHINADYSRRLGMMCHYICDYFCHPHNPAFQDVGFYRHMAYERQLQQFVQIEKRFFAKKTFSLFSASDSDELFSRINACHAEYRSHRPTMDCDIHYALRACSETVAGVLSLSAQQEQSLRPQRLVRLSVSRA